MHCPKFRDLIWCFSKIRRSEGPTCLAKGHKNINSKLYNPGLNLLSKHASKPVTSGEPTFDDSRGHEEPLSSELVWVMLGLATT